MGLDPLVDLKAMEEYASFLKGVTRPLSETVLGGQEVYISVVKRLANIGPIAIE